MSNKVKKAFFVDSIIYKDFTKACALEEKKIGEQIEILIKSWSQQYLPESLKKPKKKEMKNG